MHKRKIVHKSLSPYNIVLQNDKIKISNFSSAIIEVFDDDFESLLNINHKYVSPVMLNLECSAKSDIWSLGLILFFLNTKNHIFDFNSVDENHFSILNDYINFSSSLFKKKMNITMRNLISDFLQKDPCKRISI